jgi:hypothetical protein
MNNEVAIHYDPATPDLDSTTFFSRTFYITTPGQKYYLLFRPDMQRGDINL